MCTQPHLSRWVSNIWTISVVWMSFTTGTSDTSIRNWVTWTTNILFVTSLEKTLTSALQNVVYFQIHWNTECPPVLILRPGQLHMKESVHRMCMCVCFSTLDGKYIPRAFFLSVLHLILMRRDWLLRERLFVWCYRLYFLSLHKRKTIAIVIHRCVHAVFTALWDGFSDSASILTASFAVTSIIFCSYSYRF